MKENLNFQIIQNKSKTIPVLKEAKIPGKKYISYGEDNQFPNYLFSLYQNSTVLQSVINGIIDYTVGQGVSSVYLSDQVNTDGETYEDLFRNVFLDFLVTGGFAVNVLRDAEDRISELYWLNVGKIRLSEDGKTGFYSEDGFSWGSKVEELPIFDPSKKQKSSIFYYKGTSRTLYPIPRWSGAIPAVETSCEIAKYHLNSILNNFNPSALISFNNGVPSEEEKKAIEKKINDKFVGSNNVNRFILSFSDNGENATTIQTLGSDNTDQKYKELKESIFEEIFVAFRATPELFGIKKEGQGFNKTEYMESFDLFNKTVIEPIQKTMTKCFDKIFDTKNSIAFSKFVVYDDKIIVTENE